MQTALPEIGIPELRGELVVLTPAELRDLVRHHIEEALKAARKESSTSGPEPTVGDWQSWMDSFLEALYTSSSDGRVNVKRAAKFAHCTRDLVYRHRRECLVFEDAWAFIKAYIDDLPLDQKPMPWSKFWTAGLPTSLRARVERARREIVERSGYSPSRTRLTAKG